MSTPYLCVSVQTEPRDMGALDESGRAQVLFDVIAWKRPSATFLQELVSILEAAGVGAEGVTIFASSKAILPTLHEQPAPILELLSTGGAGPVGTHNQGAGAYRRPGAQIVAHAASWAAAATLAAAAYDAFLAVRNQAVSA